MQSYFDLKRKNVGVDGGSTLCYFIKFILRSLLHGQHYCTSWLLRGGGKAVGEQRGWNEI